MHLDYGDIIYDNPNNGTFCRKIESVQYNAALAITSAIRRTTREKLYEELGLEYLLYPIVGGVEDYVSFTKLLTIKLLLILKFLFLRYMVHLLQGPNDFNLHFSHIAYIN